MKTTRTKCRIVFQHRYGALDGTRIRDLTLTKGVLCQLSYKGIVCDMENKLVGREGFEPP